MYRQKSVNKRSRSGWEISKRLIASRLWILIACIALALPAVVYGQIECIDLCLEQFVGCLQSGGGDPIASSICQDRYDACVASCIGL
jgi:hypothetical protein